MLQDLPLDPKSLPHSSQPSAGVAKPYPIQIWICSDNGRSLFPIIISATINPEISESLACSGMAFRVPCLRKSSKIIFGY